MAPFIRRGIRNTIIGAADVAFLHNELAVGTPVVSGPGGSESLSHKTNVGVVVVEGRVKVAAAEQKVHVLAFRENHDKKLDREPLQD